MFLWNKLYRWPQFYIGVNSVTNTACQSSTYTHRSPWLTIYRELKTKRNTEKLGDENKFISPPISPPTYIIQWMTIVVCQHSISSLKNTDWLIVASSVIWLDESWPAEDFIGWFFCVAGASDFADKTDIWCANTIEKRGRNDFRFKLNIFHRRIQESKSYK